MDERDAVAAHAIGAVHRKSLAPSFRRWFGITLPEPEGRARKLAEEIAHTSGIGKLANTLHVARQLAAATRHTFTWAFFLTTLATVNSWAKGEIK